jgi:hypothetical protein
MSELNLSLYKLAEGGDLLELFEMRAEAQQLVTDAGPVATWPDGICQAAEDLKVLDEQIALYMAALPAKVDGVRAVWRRIEVLIQEAADEVKFQSRRGQHLKADLDRLKDYCQRCMELIEWPAKKPRKLEGRNGYLLLKVNGGRPAVEITDESMLPNECKTVTVTFTVPRWYEVLDSIDMVGVTGVTIGPVLPSLSLIAEALSQQCLARCDQGRILNPARDLNAPIDENTVIDCPECGGSGKRSVAGARLKPQGAHVECK